MTKVFGKVYEQIGKELNSGSYGSVFKVKSKFDGKIYALKTLVSERKLRKSVSEYLKEISEGKSGTETIGAIESNWNELKVLFSFSQANHKNFPKFYHYEGFDAKTKTPILMEFIEGKNFRDFVTLENGKIDFKKLLHSTTQLLCALDFMHKKSWFHGDLKHENVLVKNDGTVKILDFGFTLPEGKILTNPIGTLFYFAPELWEGENYTEVSDLYSLGIMLYNSITGDFRRKNDERQTLKEKLEISQKWVVKPFFVELILDLLEKETKNRNPKTASEVAKILIENSDEDLKSHFDIPYDFFKSSKLIGREREFEKIFEVLEQVVSEEQGKLVAVTGASGVGKSRFLNEFLNEVIFSESFVLKESFEKGKSSLLEILDGLVWKLGFFLTKNDVEELQEAISFLKIQILEKGKKLVAFRIFAKKLIEVLNIFYDSVKVILIVVEDLHFLQEDLEFFEIFQSELAQQKSKILFLTTFRDEEILDKTIFQERIHLKVLGQADFSNFALEFFKKAEFQIDETDENLVQKMLETTAGNPFYLEQFFSLLVENKFLKRELGNWVVSSFEPSKINFGKPSDILQARLQKLTKEEKSLLELVACCSRPTDEGIFQNLSKNYSAVCEILKEKYFLTEETDSDGTKLLKPYHHQIKDFVYSETKNKNKIHSTLARQLEKFNEKDDFTYEIAWQYEHTNSSKKKIESIRMALDKASKENFYSFKLKFSQKLIDELVVQRQENTVLFFKALQSKGQALHKIDFEEAEKSFRRAYKLAHRIGTNKIIVEACRDLGGFLATQTKIEESLKITQEGLEKVKSLRNKELKLEMQGNLGLIYLVTGNAEKGIEIYNDLIKKSGKEDFLITARAFTNLSNIYTKIAKFDLSYESAKSAIEICERNNFEDILINGYTNLATACVMSQKFEEARRNLDKAMKIARVKGNKEILVINTNSIGNTFYFQQDFKNALKIYKKMLQVATEIKSEIWINYANSNVGRVFLDLKNYEESKPYLENSRIGFERFGAIQEIHEAKFNLALWYHHKHKNQNFEIALELYKVCQKFFQENNIWDKLTICIIYETVLFYELGEKEKLSENVKVLGNEIEPKLAQTQISPIISKFLNDLNSGESERILSWKSQIF